MVGHESNDVIRGGPQQHLAYVEKLGNMADGSVQLGERQCRARKHVVQRVVPMHVVHTVLDGDPAIGRADAWHGPGKGEKLVQSTVGGSHTNAARYGFGVGGDAMHNTVKGGHDPAIREHDPWKLPRRGARCRAPRTAHGLKARPIARVIDARRAQG